ncbi:MBL fold metallo-hydrolase [Actinoalloteichus sp. AHMU CJ021]|uniref:Ribonuclease BN, tRNA processing enzyme n=2 Tax=Actinoalloteichus cyanogriseus TaxID=2893586 RepID=A0ABT1JIT1_ACTCY|nr:MBL fold metallo-hydrolase [Actinoalloteichus caeruleus]AUS78122.1 MBL fold metallo-hydrolase [Actinoalloteichus sp. AHMU CJ021]MCP2332129.1 Ribonuclease BN, tRNA processing enzyme [Actinoalloteichus caeruleus DSM 43889]
MLLTVLGCAGSVPSPTSPASGYLVTTGRTRIALDLGNGTLGPLTGHVDPFELDAVLLSHLHVDHCADLAALVVALRHQPRRPRPARRLPVHAPRGAARRLAGLYAAEPGSAATTDLTDVLDFHDLEDLTATPAVIGDLEVSAFPVPHSCPAFGFRVRHGDRVLAYTGDTGGGPTVRRLAEHADLLLAEATWPHRQGAPPGLHLSGRQAGELARRAGARRLLVTHVAPWEDASEVAAEASLAFGGPTELAEPGARHEV